MHLHLFAVEMLYFKLNAFCFYLFIVKYLYYSAATAIPLIHSCFYPSLHHLLLSIHQLAFPSFAFGLLLDHRLILSLLLFMSSISFHLSTVCCTLTARRVHHPLSGRRITSHGRLAGWPCPALPRIHTASQLIQLAWLSEETSVILITKMMYFNPSCFIQLWKQLWLMFVCLFMGLFVYVCKNNICICSGSYSTILNTTEIKVNSHSKDVGLSHWGQQDRTREEDVLKSKFGFNWIL